MGGSFAPATRAWRHFAAAEPRRWSHPQHTLANPTHLCHQATRLHATHPHGNARSPQQLLLLLAATGRHQAGCPDLEVWQRLRQVHGVDAGRHAQRALLALVLVRGSHVHGRL